MAQAFSYSLKNSMEDLSGLDAPLDAWLENSGAGAAAAYALRLALEELLTNRIKYGFKLEEEHRIEVAIARLEDGSFRLTITDDGDDFNPAAAPDPQELDSPVEQRGIGGLGLHMVKKLCSGLEHSRKDGVNTLTVTVQDKGE
ncbi:MAG TPA: ATP-binding protein [Elusimicrobiales bacterium]|nr:ATP-binding protein [Elusimicrobiales bacterium]